jgi:hypothetical protein
MCATGPLESSAPLPGPSLPASGAEMRQVEKLSVTRVLDVDKAKRIHA